MLILLDVITLSDYLTDSYNTHVFKKFSKSIMGHKAHISLVAAKQERPEGRRIATGALGKR